MNETTNEGSYSPHPRTEESLKKTTTIVCQQFNSLDEMDTFLEPHNLPRLNQEDIQNQIEIITINEIEGVINKTSNKRKSRTNWLRR